MPEPVSKKNNKWPEHIAQLYNTLYAVIIGYVQDNDVAAQAASDALSALLSSPLAGTQVYIPKDDTMRRMIRDMNIYSDFNGRNVQCLAAKYNLTERQVYAIIKCQRVTHLKDRQAELLP